MMPWGPRGGVPLDPRVPEWPIGPWGPIGPRGPVGPWGPWEPIGRCGLEPWGSEGPAATSCDLP